MPSLAHPIRGLPVCAALLVALAASGCVTRAPATTASVASPAEQRPRTEADWRAIAAASGKRYGANPGDAGAALAYGQALRNLDQRAQAVAVLEQAAIRHPQNPEILAAYGRALADEGRLDQALKVLGQAHRPDRPDWRILNAQGAILDQLGRSREARSYYETALKSAPGEPSILSNLGLSYVLTKELDAAEATLRQAGAHPRATARVRQNLALAVALKGRAPEAVQVLSQDMDDDAARALVESWSNGANKRG